MDSLCFIYNLFKKATDGLGAHALGILFARTTPGTSSFTTDFVKMAVHLNILLFSYLKDILFEYQCQQKILVRRTGFEPATHSFWAAALPQITSPCSGSSLFFELPSRCIW